MRRLCLLLLSISCICGAVIDTVNAQPVITDVDLRGLQAGAATELNFSGRNLTKGTRAFLPFPFQQKTVSENGSSKLRLKIEIPLDTTPGLYPVRLFNEQGLSEPILLGVDKLPHRPFSSQTQKLPVALSGKLVGAQIHKASFQAQPGELVIVEIEAARLGSKLRPVLQVYNERGKLVGFAQQNRTLEGDCRCFFKAATGGQYTVEFHDFLFRGASPGHFRLKIGNFQYADLCFPVGLTAGQKSAVRMIKNGAASEFLQEVTPAQPGWLAIHADHPLFSGQAPKAIATSLPEFVETKQSSEPQKAGAVPLGINGRLEANGEIDRFEIDVTPNSKLRFDLLGRRIGSAIDGKITLRNLKGQLLAQNDDRKGEQDALLDFNVPNIKSLIVEVSDISARGSKSHVYRLVIQHQKQPEVAVVLNQNTINIAAKGTTYVPVNVVRSNYSGPVELILKGLPDAYEVAGSTIKKGSDVGLLTISTSRPTPAAFTLESRIVAGEQEIRSDVLGPETSFAKKIDLQRKHFAVAPAQANQLTVKWSGLKEQQTVNLGGHLRTQVKVHRPASATGPVRVRLVTNQKVPKKRVRVNNKDSFVDDIDKAIRAGSVELATGKNDGEVNIEIPATINEQPWDLLLVAEILSADKKKVLAAAATKPLTIQTKRLAAVDVTEGKAIQLPRQGSYQYTVRGTIAGNQEQWPLRVRLTGLPKGTTVPPTVVQTMNQAFEAKLTIPVSAELLKVKKLNLEFAFLDRDDPSWVVAQDSPRRVKVSVEPAPAKTAPAKTKPAKTKPAKK